jgi:hypothetical protein
MAIDRTQKGHHLEKYIPDSNKELVRFDAP